MTRGRLHLHRAGLGEQKHRDLLPGLAPAALRAWRPRAEMGRREAELTWMTKGSGWLCSSSSPHTATVPPLAMLPPTKTCERAELRVAETGKRGWSHPKMGQQWRGKPVLPYLSHQPGPAGVGDVVLADVSVQPVAEVEEPVVQRDEDVGDEALGRGRQSCTPVAARGRRLHRGSRGHTHLACPGAATPPPSCWGLGSPSQLPSLLAAGQSTAPKGSVHGAEAG